MPLKAKIKQVVCGQYFTVLLSFEGEVFSCGENDKGQLGLGHTQRQMIPILMMKDEQVTDLFCGNDHCFLFKMNGDLLGWGTNIRGQLGLGNTQSSQKSWMEENKPVLVLNDPTLESVNGRKLQLQWRPEKHSRYPSAFRQRILTFVLSLKVFHQKTALKLPKFLLFEIIKKSC